MALESTGGFGVGFKGGKFHGVLKVKNFGGLQSHGFAGHHPHPSDGFHHA